jgi:hypothetical protein
MQGNLFNKIPKAAIVKIRWYDSAFEHGWNKRDGDPPKPLDVIESVGWITFMSKQMIEVASTKSEACVLNPLAIPLGAIISVKQL